MKKAAYTLAEIMIVVTILAVLTLLTTTTLFNSPKTKYRKIAAYSSSFYSNATSAYTEILTNEARNYSIENLNDRTGDGNIDSSDLASYFAYYIGGEMLENVNVEEDGSDDAADSGDEQNNNGSQDSADSKNTNCSDLTIAANSDIASYKNNAVCAEFTNIIAGFVYDSTCSTSIKVKEFLTKDEVDGIVSDNYEPPERNSSNLCGYIVYGIKGGEGEFKKDLFTIPLGKRSIK